MNEFVRLLALATALFCLGIYGLLTRRTFAGAFVALAVMLGAVALTLIAGNYFIRPSDAYGYLFVIIMLAVGALYASLAAPFLMRELREARAREAAETESHALSDLLENAVSDSGSVAFQISIAVSFIAAVLLFRVTIVGFIAFVAGVVSLKVILARRLRTRRREQAGAGPAQRQTIDLSMATHAAERQGGAPISE